MPELCPFFATSFIWSTVPNIPIALYDPFSVYDSKYPISRITMSSCMCEKFSFMSTHYGISCCHSTANIAKSFSGIKRALVLEAKYFG